jgi:hypothetical protein
MSAATAKRVLPADVYDALELAALAFDGIGAGFMYHYNNTDMPCCVHGLAQFACDDMTMNNALFIAGIEGKDNDAAVAAINERKNPGGYTDTNVTFEEWCAELGVVRGAK